MTKSCEPIRCFFLHSCCCSLVNHQGPNDLSPYVFLHIISLFSVVTDFNKKDTYSAPQVFPGEWSKLIYMQLAGSLPHTNHCRTQQEGNFGAHLDITCKMYRSLCSLASICKTTLAASVAAAAVFQHLFSKYSSVAVAAAGWPSFPTSAEIWSFRSALLRWPRGRVLWDSFFSPWFPVFPAML